MANKRYTTQLRIQAVDKYSKTVKAMGKTTGRFSDQVRRDLEGLQAIRGPLKLIEDFKAKQAVMRKSGESLDAAREKVRELAAEIKRTKQPTAKMRAEFDRARASADKLEVRHRKNRQALNTLRSELHSTGVDTSRLAGAEQRLKSALDASSAGFDRKITKLKRVAEMQERIARSREQMDRSLARAANVSFVGAASVQTGRRILSGVASPVGQAKQLETAMADVRKVVDFDSPEGLRQMRRDIQALSTDIPMTAEELAQIVASGGQSGIAKAELIEFAELAAKVGVAFDISAEMAGDSMAKVKTAMELNLKETSNLFNAMNHLSNNSAARADQTLEFLNRAGSDGARYGFSANETLTYGAAMIAAGAQADTAATSFRNMGRALTRGASSTDRQSEAFKKLGLDAEKVALAMQQDAVGTTNDVIRRLNDLPKHVQASVMSDLFGDEARELGKLINNMQLQPKMLKLLADPADYLGSVGEPDSVEKEYRARAATTQNNEQLLANEWKRVQSAAGETILPVYNEILTTMRGLLKTTTAWIEEHPTLTRWLVIGAAALGGMAVAGGALLTAGAALIGTIAVLRFGLAGLGARAIFASGGLGGVASRIMGMSSIAPNFGPAAAGFSGLRRSALSELDLLKNGVDTRTAAMNRSLSRLKWKGALAGLTTYLAMQQVPEEPEELQAFQERNRRRLDGALRSVPGLGWMMEKYEGAVEWVHGAPPKTDEAFLPQDDATRAAVKTVERFAPENGRPTAERVAHLREEVAAYRQEVEAAQEALASAPEFASGITNPLRITAQADLDAALSGLRAAEERFEEAEVASAELAEAIRVLDGARVAPVVDTASIDRALAKIKELVQAARNPSGGGSQLQTSLGPAREVTPIAGARARGGPIKAGLPYLAGELGPEPIFSSRSAYVATHRQFEAMQRMAGVARRSGAIAATVASVAAPAAAGSAAPAGGRTVHIDNISIEIPVPGSVSDPQSFAVSAAGELGRRLSSVLEGRFSD